MSTITSVVAEEHLTGHVRAWLEYFEWDEWDITRVDLNLGTMSKPRWIEVRDPELRDALIDDLSNDKRFQADADRAHADAFDFIPEASHG